MSVRINNEGSTRSFEEIVWICDLADLFSRELATQSAITADWKNTTKLWTISLQVRQEKYSLELDPMNFDPVEVDGFIAVIKLLNG